MTVSVRPVVMRDYAVVCGLYREGDRLHAEGAPHMFVDGGSLPRTREWLEAVIGASDGTLLVAEVEAEVVGLVRLAERRVPDGPPFRPRRFVMVEELVVRGDWRRRGVGRALMERAEAWARQRGIGEVELTVWAFNGPAQALFGGLGYATVQHRMRRVITP